MLRLWGGLLCATEQFPEQLGPFLPGRPWCQGRGGDSHPGPKGATGDKGVIGPKGAAGSKGLKGQKGPTAAACYSHSGRWHPDEPSLACSETLKTYYSDCTTIGDGCFIYDDSGCSSCTSDGFWVHAATNLAYELGGCQISGPILSCGRSDIRVKKGVQTLTNVLENIEKIQIREYDWNEKLSNYEFLKERDKLHSIGMVAQELREIYPEFVYRRGDGYLSIHYQKLNAVIIQGIKEQQELINDIDADIIHLKSVLE